MKYLALMSFSPRLHGVAAKAAGTTTPDYLSNDEVSPIISNDVISYMPLPQKGIIYIVNALVFEHLKNQRKDIVSFDPQQSKRDKQGLVISQGGFITT